MTNFQNLIQTSDFNPYHVRTVWFTRQASGNWYLDFIRILVAPKILLTQVISENFERHCLYSTDSHSRSHKQEWFWHLLCKDNILFTRKASGKQNLDLLPKPFLKNLRSTAHVQLINIQDTIHKSDFDIYGLVAIFNFSQNLAENQYISGGFLRILVPFQILAPPWHFWKKLDNYCSFITD